MDLVFDVPVGLAGYFAQKDGVGGAVRDRGDGTGFALLQDAILVVRVGRRGGIPVGGQVAP